jgi:hypothetical protein
LDVSSLGGVASSFWGKIARAAAELLMGKLKLTQGLCSPVADKYVPVAGLVEACSLSFPMRDAVTPVSLGALEPALV